MAAFTEHLATHYVPNTVIVDATASEVHISSYYLLLAANRKGKTEVNVYKALCM